MDNGPTGRQNGCIGNCREHLTGNHPPHVKKNELKPWQVKQWCMPEASGDFVAKMEDVLEVYHRPYSPERPVICLDETNRQLIAETRVSRPASTREAQKDRL